MDKYFVSERPACGLVGLSRAAYRCMPLPRDDEVPFGSEVVRLACIHGRCDYRTIVGMMRMLAGAQAKTAKDASHLARGRSEDPAKQPPPPRG
jgi:putative transposase